jgi:hypothetical protein
MTGVHSSILSLFLPMCQGLFHLAVAGDVPTCRDSSKPGEGMGLMCHFRKGCSLVMQFGRV